MPSRPAKLLPTFVLGALASLSACQQEQPTAPAAPTATETRAAITPGPSDEPSADASAASDNGIAANLDTGALQERRDPERLLRFYTNAIRVGDWTSAAKAWTLDAVATPDKLRSEFGGDVGPKVAVGKGDWSNAAGSLYYEAPVTIDFADGRASRRGTIVLRRANDVPGASPLQLVWRIERSSLLGT